MGQVRVPRARMDDVARRVGVSRTTVSFVLNNRPDVSVSSETRRRIHEVAAELGYRPHAGARALAAQRSGLIGMVTEIVTSPFGPEIIKGAQDEAWRSGSFLLIAASEGQPELESMAIERLLEQRVEGLIFASSTHVEMTLPPSLDGVPTILVHATDPRGLVPSIVPDEESGGALATRRPAGCRAPPRRPGEPGTGNTRGARAVRRLRPRVDRARSRATTRILWSTPAERPMTASRQHAAPRPSPPARCSVLCD